MDSRSGFGDPLFLMEQRCICSNPLKSTPLPSLFKFNCQYDDVPKKLPRILHNLKAIISITASSSWFHINPRHHLPPLLLFSPILFSSSRGASTDPTTVLAPIAQSEFQVYDYLVESAASVQTRECINEFMKRTEKYGLMKSEKLNIINIRPSSIVEIDPIIEECDQRMEPEVVEELVDMVNEVLPAKESPQAADDNQEPTQDN